MVCRSDSTDPSPTPCPARVDESTLTRNGKRGCPPGSLSNDESRLNYEITINDPATFTEPVTLGGYRIWVPGEEIKPYNCTL